VLPICDALLRLFVFRASAHQLVAIHSWFPSPEELQKQQRKDGKQQPMAARKSERKKVRAEKAAPETIKKAQRKEETIQKQAAKQLQDRVKSTNQKQLGKRKKVSFDIAEGSIQCGVREEEGPSVSRARRVRKQRQHLQGYMLYIVHVIEYSLKKQYS
jgi:hypothetical protein